MCSHRQNRNLEINRRDLMKAAAMGLAGAAGGSSWLPGLGQALAASKKQQRHCIVLWMTGGPTQTDTFDMKPNHANGGQFKEIQTAATGLRFSENMPKLAKIADQMAVVRSLSTREGDHDRGTYLMHTGHRPGGPIKYPTLGSILSKEIGDETSALPSFVSIGTSGAFNQRAYQPGFLGPRFARLRVGENRETRNAAQLEDTNAYAALGVDDLQPPATVTSAQVGQRVDLLRGLQDRFVKRHAVDATVVHNTAVQRAIRLMRSEASSAFDLSDESDSVREAYGRGRFGQGCLMARRLVERGVGVVEVSLGDFGRWDTHQNNFPVVKQLSEELDAGWSMLMSDLQDRSLLDSTTIIWIGEFGRTPRINGNAGRDHFPRAWSCVLAGGGIKGGGAYGRTDAGGTTVEEDQCSEGDVLATLCKALKIDPDKQNISELGRPIRLAEGEAVEKLLS